MSIALAVSACGKKEEAQQSQASGAAATEEKILHVYNWSDYIAEDTIKNFEEQTGIKVTYDVFDSNDMLETRLLAGNSGFDVVVPSASFLERQIDLLAYGVSPDDAAFTEVLAIIRAGRMGRAWLMVQRLNEFGHPVSWERVQEIAGSENVGRPHVARAMVEAGVVPTIKAAFTNEFILDGGRCYVQRVKISPAEAIERIHAAGGVAVAAHPARTALSDEDVMSLVDAGLDGLEVFYARHSPAETARFAELASAHRMLVTGGSDDHGAINEGRLMGRVRLPYHHVERLKEAIALRSVPS
jgi:predicted metal-dependent phosphoesterase TrpH